MPTLPVPRLPLLPDLLRRVEVPRELDGVTTISPGEVPPESVGMTARGIARIWKATQILFCSGIYPAISLCVRREGEVVLDRAIGWARYEDRTPARPQTPFAIFSASKAMTATIAHLLDERGLIHVDDRVCEYIPEYARHGKEAITIEHVLSHRAGVPNLPGSVLDLENVGDRELLLEA